MWRGHAYAVPVMMTSCVRASDTLLLVVVAGCLKLARGPDLHTCASRCIGTHPNPGSYTGGAYVASCNCTVVRLWQTA